MVAPTIEVRIDSDGDELFASGDDVTSDVRAAEGIGITRGNQLDLPLAEPRSGAAQLELGNDADHGNGAYSPGGGSEPTKGTRVRIRATDPTTGTTHDLFRGLIQSAEQHPEISRQSVGCLARDPMALLTASGGVATELYEDITTDVALGHLCDAIGFPKNLQAYLTALGPAFQYGLGEASGAAVDLSGNGNDGTVTIGAGSRAAAALDDGGDGAIDCDGADTKVEVADAAAIQDIWDGGGALVFIIDPDSDGEGDAGVIVSKGWQVRVVDESGGNLRIELEVPFSTTAGIWQTARDVAAGSRLLGLLAYDADEVANDPTLWTFDLETETFTARTVDSGLTETQTPVGTRTTDVGTVLVIGNVSGQTATFDGDIDEVAGFVSTLTAAQAAASSARALDAPRHFDTGQTSLEQWWLDPTMAPWEEALALKNSEGPGAALYADGTGALVFKNRHARVLESRSTTVQTTFRGTGAEPLHSEPLTRDDGKDDVVNFAVFDVTRRSAKSLSVIWSLGETLTLAAGETRSLRVADADRTPFTALVTPVLNTDYTVSAGSLSSVSVNRTSGSQATLTLTAGASGATVTGLQARAQLVSVDGVTPVETTIDTAASQAQNGLRSWDFNAHPVRSEIAVSVAQDWVNAAPGWWQDGRPKLVPLTVHANRGTAALTAALSREIGDRIAVHSARIALAGEEHWIERVEVAISAAQQLTWHCWAQKAIDADYGVWDEGDWDVPLWGW